VSTFLTRASSINRALDQIGDKWCLLIIQEVFWGINSFSEMMAATGVSKSVLSDRLLWLQTMGCLNKAPLVAGGKRMGYHLTTKSIELYDCALMAIAWERKFFIEPSLDQVQLTHSCCNHTFQPGMECQNCAGSIDPWDVNYQPGPGATQDEREKKVRRRSSISVLQVPSDRSLYKNLIHIVGDRWSANLTALAFHGLCRFDEFHRELPIATNILTDRLKFLVGADIFTQIAYQQRPSRYEYQLTNKGLSLFPWFISLLQWGDKWCGSATAGNPVQLTHTACNQPLHGQVVCSHCHGVLRAHEVIFALGNESAVVPG
jgi:DNA-binding HxlR family transcriptional regulator